ncbi:MAG: mechanosensitive ion channel family protein [Bacteroidaceae bacterium]|nr:mechanosensitive ion channel family protein [Bacteroidaceae bacterium]
MRRIASALALCLLVCMTAQAVLREKDLARTLGVLRAELAADYNRQQMFMQMYEQQGARQHEQLVSYMNRCEQIGLMLYSQSADNTFDMAYACQQAVDLFREVNDPSNRFHAYGKAITKIKSEIERYDALIASLKSIPPVEEGDEELLTESDSILLSAIDSLEAKRDSLDGEGKPAMPLMPQEQEELNREPLYLSGQQLQDRKACLEYAQTMRDNMQTFLEALEAESSYYQSVKEKVGGLNRFAQKQYKRLQDNIFKEGGANYFSVLGSLPRYIVQAHHSVRSKYKPFKQHEQGYSEWRGVSVLFISIFVTVYLSLALLIAYCILRWLSPKRWRRNLSKTRRQMLTWIVGTALFAVYVMGVHKFVQRNYIQMGTGLIMNFAWLLEIVLLSLYIRLKGKIMTHAALVYMPLIVLSFIVIMFRIILVPNSILNLIFPPILLVFVLWQLRMAKRHSDELPMQDVIYTNVTSTAMLVSCVVAWAGYTFMAVQIIVWWMFQLAAITTITCVYDLMKRYEENKLARRILAASGQEEAKTVKDIRKEMAEGLHITRTWAYDFVNRTLVPILAVLSVLVSIYWAAEVFEMTSVCQKAFFRNFIDQKDLIQISLFKLCLVAALGFLFGYINYAVRSFYAHYRRLTTPPDEVLNLTLARNVIAIIAWGLYFIIVLVILNVPKSGISIVTAGLATGLGFAMQELIENFFYGISLMAGRLRVGDYIEVADVMGKVESITYQSTQITTADGCVISFLNKDLLGKNFKNMTRNHNYELISIPVGVAYGTNIDQVRQILSDALAPLCQQKNPDGQPLTDPERPLNIRFADFGASSVDLKVFFWGLVSDRYGLMALAKETIYNALNEHHIEIPFPQRDVHIIQ